MSTNKQTSNFPPFTLPEQSWSNNLRALAVSLFPQGILKGLTLGLPTGNSLAPTLTDGYVINGDEVIGPVGSQVPVAPANANRLGLYYGLEGFFYASATEAKVPTNPMYQEPGMVKRGVLVGEVSSNAETLVMVTQYRHLDTSRMGIHSVIRPHLLAKGSDVLLAEVELPHPSTVRLSYALMRVVTALTGVTTASDNARLRYAPLANNATISDWASFDGAALSGAVGSQAAHNTPAYSAGPVDGIRLYWHLTDADSSITGGVIEVNAVIELL